MIPAELEDLLRSLERFEEIRRSVVSLGPQLCDLSYANPYDGAADRVHAVLRRALDQDRLLALQYSPFGGQVRARRAVADALRRSHDLPFAFSDVTLTPGAMAALHIALRTAAAPGDQVLIPTPCWLDYPLYARYLGLEPVLVPLPGPEFGLDAAALAAAITPRTRAILLSHPANPTGRSYTKNELCALAGPLERAEALSGKPITLIADEAHRDFVESGAYFTAAAVWPRTLLVYSFGKYHFMQGQRIGYVAVSPTHPSREAVAHELMRWVRIMGFATPTAVMQQAIPDLLALRHDHSRVYHWRHRYATALRSAGYELVSGDATLFLYVRTPAGSDDFQFIQRLARGGLLALPASLFHHRGYFRLSLTGDEAMLERALGILRRLSVPCVLSQ